MLSYNDAALLAAESWLMASAKQIFAHNLNRILKDRGVSAAQLARKLEIADGNVSNWRNGKVLPQAESLDKIAEVLGEGVPEFFKPIEASSSIKRSRVTPEEALRALADEYGFTLRIKRNS